MEGVPPPICFWVWLFNVLKGLASSLAHVVMDEFYLLSAATAIIFEGLRLSLSLSWS